MGTGELGERPQDTHSDTPASAADRRPAGGRQDRAQPRRGPAETQSREDYGEGMRSRGEPIPGSTGHDARAGPARTGHEARAGPASADKPPVERPPPDEPGDRERTEPRGGDTHAGDRGDRRADPVSGPAEAQPGSAESVRNDAPRGGAEDEPDAVADAATGLSPGNADRGEALTADRETESSPLWHFHADYKDAHTDLYLDQDGHFRPGPDAQPTASLTGDAAPGQRAGDLIANLEDPGHSRAEAIVRRICEEGEDLRDGVQDLTDTARDYFARPALSAHAAVDTRPTVTHPAHDETDTGTGLTGLVLLAALGIRGGQLAIECRRRRKDEVGDQQRSDDRAPDPADRELQ